MERMSVDYQIGGISLLLIRAVEEEINQCRIAVKVGVWPFIVARKLMMSV